MKKKIITAFIYKKKYNKTISPEFQEKLKKDNAIINAIKKALREGPMTPPELAEKIGLETHIVFWYLMTMRKYGIVKEVGLEGDYYKYALVGGKK